MSIININTPLTGNKFRIMRSNGDYIDFPGVTALQERGLDRRVKMRDRLRGDGAIGTGDRSFNARNYILKYNVYDSDEDNVADDMNTLEGFFRREYLPYYLIDKDRSIRIRVELLGNRVNYPAGNRNISNIGCELSLATVNALWESVDQFAYPGGTGSVTGEAITGGTGTGSESGVGVLLENEDSLILVNPCQFDVYPRFIFTLQNNIYRFTFRNLTNDSGFVFDSRNLIAGVTLITDSDSGDFTLNNVDATAYMTEGGPIRLIPGANQLQYESENGSVLFEAVWRTRFAY